MADATETKRIPAFKLRVDLGGGWVTERFNDRAALISARRDYAGACTLRGLQALSLVDGEWRRIREGLLLKAAA